MRTVAVVKNCLDREKELVLAAAEKDDKVLFFNSEEELLASSELEDIEIVFGEPEHSTINSMKKLRWIHMTWAGANKYTSWPDYPRNVELTSASGAYGHVISEYVLSGLLALTRKLFLYRTQMEEGGWSRLEDDTLEGKRVLILGTGDIGQQTARKLKCFGAYTVGICRTPGKTAPDFDEIYTVDRLDEQLPLADIAVIAMPGTAETKGMFDAQRISKMKKTAILANIGRGFIVDTEALTEALGAGHLKGAVIDVTEPEPLPEAHPLRKMENVVLTPHVSGIGWAENMFTRKRLIDIFADNLKRDIKGEPKRNIIDFGKGY